MAAGLGDAEKKKLKDLGLEVCILPGSLVQRASRYLNEHLRLKLNDCFALSLAGDFEDSILLTGDGLLRRIAEDKGIEARVVLWATDQMEVHEIASLQVLYDAKICDARSISLEN